MRRQYNSFHQGGEQSENEEMSEEAILEENFQRIARLERENKNLKKLNRERQTALWLDEELIYLQINEISQLQGKVKGLKRSVNKVQVALEGSQHKLGVTKKVLNAQKRYVKKLRLNLHRVREQNRKLKKQNNL